MPLNSERHVVVAQGGYYVVTGVLPFVSRRTFELLTGPKSDWWLVETVGALVTVIGGTLLGAGLRRRVSPELGGLAVGSASVLAAIDVAYVLRRRIAPTYLLDAAAQLAVLGALGASRAGHRHRSASESAG